MQFGSFLWPNEPSHLRCSYRRLLQSQSGVWSLSDQGYGGCTVVAEGDFYTSGSATALEALFRTGGALTLRLPNAGSFTARFTALTLEQEPVAGCIHYTATFQETPA